MKRENYATVFGILVVGRRWIFFVKRFGLVCIGVDWIGLPWFGLVCLDWFVLDWFGLV